MIESAKACVKKQMRPLSRNAFNEAEIAAGASPEEVCARSIRELSASGVRHFYVSNLPVGRAATTIRSPEFGIQNS